MSKTPSDPPPSGESLDWFTRARHIFFGTAATVVEMIEDPSKREENWGKMSMDLNALADELAAKGQYTEAEALRQMQKQQEQQEQQQSSPSDSTATDAPDPAPKAGAPSTPSPSPAPAPGPGVSEPVSSPAPQGEPVSVDDISALMDLTREVERLRRDLERRRTQDSHQ